LHARHAVAAVLASDAAGRARARRGSRRGDDLSRFVPGERGQSLWEPNRTARPRAGALAPHQIQAARPATDPPRGAPVRAAADLRSRFVQNALARAPRTRTSRRRWWRLPLEASPHRGRPRPPRPNAAPRGRPKTRRTVRTRGYGPSGPQAHHEARGQDAQLVDPQRRALRRPGPRYELSVHAPG